jgi:ABC-type uncharacterized transport system permease subunit
MSGVREHVNEGEAIELPRLRGLVLSGARPILGIILALLVSAGLISARGSNPIVAYAAMLQGAFGSVAALANTGVRAAPIILSGFAVGLGYKAGLWNIGGTGQIYLGATTATVVGIIPLPVPAWLHLLLAVIAGFVGGALWMFVPAYLCAYRGVNLVCTTLMLDYVAGFFVSWLLHEPSPLAEKGAFFPMSPSILPSARLPILVKGTSLHAGFVLAVVLGVVLQFVLRHTPFGFRTRMVGENPEAARYAGVDVVRWILFILLICGGMAGLAGAGEVLGLKLRLFDYFEGFVGFEGLALAIMVEGNPLGIILAGIFFGSLKAGAGKMQIATGIGTPMAMVIEALAVLFVIAIGFGERGGFARVPRKKTHGKEG